MRRAQPLPWRPEGTRKGDCVRVCYRQISDKTANNFVRHRKRLPCVLSSSFSSLTVIQATTFTCAIVRLLRNHTGPAKCAVAIVQLADRSSVRPCKVVCARTVIGCEDGEATMRVGVMPRIASIVVATVVIACFSATSANAASAKNCNGKSNCYTSQKKVVKKKTAKRSARHARTKSYRRTTSVRTASWHGWVVRSPAVLYHEGTAYSGGTRHGPATWYNNYEGGFNGALFWKLSDRNGP